LDLPQLLELTRRHEQTHPSTSWSPLWQDSRRLTEQRGQRVGKTLSGVALATDRSEWFLSFRGDDPGGCGTAQM